MDIIKQYKVGHEYIDDIANSREKDQLVNWLPGIGNSKGIRPAKTKDKKSIAFIVLITRQISQKHYNPWDDIVDYNSSTIYYWGDAKFNEFKNYDDFEGNKCLLGVYEKYLTGELIHVPPILHFSKKSSGKIIFNGLCIINRAELTWFEDNQRPVKNFRFELNILDQDIVNVEWLIDRINYNTSNKLHEPSVWRSFINGRVVKLNIFKKSILSKNEQLPNDGSVESKILDQIISLRPLEFEALLVELFRELPHVNHNIIRTQYVKDGGFDFIGNFSLPYPINYTIEFLGEAKKYGRDNPVGPDLISRLVARLSRGQYGIFVTTSYYTNQAQQEVLEDNYPVKLYSGIDVVNFIRELRLIENGEIKKDWLCEIIQSLSK